LLFASFFKMPKIDLEAFFMRWLKRNLGKDLVKWFSKK
jgi:hypothetical protein